MKWYALKKLKHIPAFHIHRKYRLLINEINMLTSEFEEKKRLSSYNLLNVVAHRNLLLQFIALVFHPCCSAITPFSPQRAIHYSNNATD